MLKLIVFLTYSTITMKRLYKIILLFLVIFLVGIYFTMKSINNSFSTENDIETVTTTPSLIKLSLKL
jgi:hypothetical protein